MNLDRKHKPNDPGPPTCLWSGGATRQENGHGHYVRTYSDKTNQRLKVIEYWAQDWDALVRSIENTARRDGLGKILFNVRAADGTVLSNYGFLQEGEIPGFFHGETALCFSYFTNPSRRVSSYIEQEDSILQQVLERPVQTGTGLLSPDFTLHRIDPGQADLLAKLYDQVFESYPSPLTNPDYIRTLIPTKAVFYGVFHRHNLVSAASIEIDAVNSNAELTDCATLPDFRGRGFLTSLIPMLEEESRKRKHSALYSLARAGSFGMNAVLRKLGYGYRGRFINNCHIGGRFEDMNLWTKEMTSSILT